MSSEEDNDYKNKIIEKVDEHDCSLTDDFLVCPYCGYKHYDSVYEYAEGNNPSYTICNNCEKEFNYEYNIIYSFTSYPKEVKTAYDSWKREDFE